MCSACRFRTAAFEAQKKGLRARTPDPVLAVVGLRWTAIEPDDGHATDTPDTSSTGTREIKLRIYMDRRIRPAPTAGMRHSCARCADAQSDPAAIA